MKGGPTTTASFDAETVDVADAVSAVSGAVRGLAGGLEGVVAAYERVKNAALRAVHGSMPEGVPARTRARYRPHGGRRLPGRREEAVDHLARWNEADRELSGLTRVATVRPLPSHVIVKNAIDVTHANGVPMTFDWTGDASRRHGIFERR